MVFNTKGMQGVPVETRLGQTIGKVVSFDFEGETGRLWAVRVKPRGSVSSLLVSDLIIHWGAVIEITAEKVVVAENAVRKPSEVFASEAPPILPSLMKEG